MRLGAFDNMEMINRNAESCEVEGVSLRELAKQHGTPLFVYSKKRLLDNSRRYLDAFSKIGAHICFAVKANSNLSILKIFANAGHGFDIVSVGELERLIAAGVKNAKVIFSGVGKTEGEIERALDYGIYSFNIESRFEIEMIQEVARRMGRKAPVSVRVNPNVDPKTHPYISTGLKSSKFGVPHDEAVEIYKIIKEQPNLEIAGIDCHIGSQITEVEPFLEAARKMVDLVDKLANEGIEIKHLDLGGGVGISYEGEEIFSFDEYAEGLKKIVGSRNLKIILEPGRSLVGDAGVLVTRVLGVKRQGDKNFVVIDAAMNDLIRPTLYEAYHEIGNVDAVSELESPEFVADIVGPVCESGDFVAKDRKIRAAKNAYLWIADAGAYGMSMASNYNSRNRPAEILVSDGQAHVIREREKYAEQWRNEASVLDDSVTSVK